MSERYWSTERQQWVYPGRPLDYAEPDWDSAGTVHEWKNYISERLRAMWDTFTDDQRAAIAESAYESAGREEWD